MRNRSVLRAFWIAPLVLLATALVAEPVTAVTYLSAEPIPSADVVGPVNLAKIESIGYQNMELWSVRLLNDCQMVQKVIAALSSNGAIHSVNPGNTRFLVAAGGFEAVTDPSFVLTLQDDGTGAVSATDVSVLDNALGYVLNQSGTAHFSPDHPKAYDFSLDYAVVTFSGTLTGLEAKGFFDDLGTVDAALWSGPYAGFTQISFNGSSTNNSMLFLKPAAPKRELVDGLFAAASATPGATYVTLNNNGQPTTDKAGVSFPGNDWTAFPNGDQYLAQLGAPTPRLLNDLGALRQRHLRAVADLLDAINRGKVSAYLNTSLKCE
jgi:hypothetical protein